MPRSNLNVSPGVQGFQRTQHSAPVADLDLEPEDHWDDRQGTSCPDCGGPRRLYDDERYYCGCETGASACPSCGDTALEHDDEGYSCASCDYQRYDD